MQFGVQLCEEIFGGQSMKILLLTTFVIAGCTTIGEISEMKDDAKTALANIAKISDVVKVNLGTEKEAQKRKTTIDGALNNVEKITAQVKVVTAKAEEASGRLSKIVQNLSDPEIGVPEVLRKLDAATGAANKSLNNVKIAN